MAEYGVTSSGFKAKRYEEIFSDIKTRFKTELGIDLDRNPDMVAKVISNIITLPIAQSWSNTQSLQSMFDLDKAEGRWLDNLASFYGITRSEGSYPRGRQTITVSAPTTVLSNEQFTSKTGSKFTNEGDIIIKEDTAVSVSYKTTTNNPLLKTSEITVDGVVYTASATDPATTGISNIADTINQDGNTQVTARVYNEGLDTFIEINSNQPYERHSFSASNNLTLNQMSGFGEIKSVNLGANVFQENTVTGFPSYTNIISTTNLEPIDDGAGEEKDYEFRIRIKSARSTGKATIAQLKAALLAVNNVSTAIVLENDTEEQDIINNIPKKSFKCIVKGGDREDIAKAIWDTKPAGIATSGLEEESVRDSEGDLQTVRFSRVENKYIHVNIRYSLYDEEQAPVNVEEAIKQQVLAYGSTLDVGVDVIQGRIAAGIYQNISGLERVVVRVGSTVSPSDSTPTLNETPPVSVISSEEADFDYDRIVVTQI